MRKRTPSHKGDKPFTLGGLLALGETHNTRMEAAGIYAYGFGNLYVCGAVDRRLSICDKGVLAYLSTYCGDGGICTCKQKTILRALRVTDHTLSASMSRLIKYGYVIRERSFHSGKFGQYSYAVIHNPDKQSGWLNMPYCTPGGADASFHVPLDRYGAVSKLIMNDQRLSVKEKGFYAALCALCGNANQLVCHRDILAALLQICPDTASRYISKLSALGLVQRSNTVTTRRGLGPSLFTVVALPPNVPYPETFRQQDKRRVASLCHQDTVDEGTVNSILGRTLGKVISPLQSLILAQQARDEESEEDGKATSTASANPTAEEAAAVRSKIAVQSRLDNLEVRDGRTHFIPSCASTEPIDRVIEDLRHRTLSEQHRHHLKMIAYQGIPSDYTEKRNFTRLQLAVAQSFEHISVSTNEDVNILREIIKSVTYLSSERRPVVINGSRNNPKQFLRRFNRLLESFALPPLVEELIQKIKRAIYTRGVRYLSGYINHCVYEMVCG
ncbi:MAG: hypothetical protein IJD81_03255 [Oscillospiraceae bacterium]|nr:hypothetical protein [Oscillospiraceae bacterium]